MDHRYDTDIFRHNLKQARLISGYGQRELSKEAKLRNLKRVGDLEDGSGDPTIDEMYALSIVLNQPFDKMLTKKAKVTIEWE